MHCEKNVVMQQDWHPNRDTTEPKMSLGRVIAWSWLWVARDTTEAEEPEERESTGEIPTELSFPRRCVLVYLCATTAGAWFLEVRHATEAEPSGLGVSVGGIPAWRSWPVWYRMACWLDEWHPPCKYS